MFEVINCLSLFQVKFEMDLVRKHEIESEDSVLYDLSEHKPLRRKIKIEPLSPSSSPSLDVSSESDSVQKVPSLDDLYDEASLGGKFSRIVARSQMAVLRPYLSLALRLPCRTAPSERFLGVAVSGLTCHLHVCLHRMATFALFAFTASSPKVGRAPV